MFKHLLVPTDGSELSEKTARSAVELAKAVGAKITGFYAKEVFPLTYYGEYVTSNDYTPEEFEEAQETRAKRYLSAVEKIAQDAGVAVDVYSFTSHSPHEAILKAAAERGCDGIFMATHGRKGISGLLLGSETTKVLTHAKVPVIAYR
jgi:nucleotide-binding universal stress UspA family protein